MLNVISVYQFWVKSISMTSFIDTHCHGIPLVDDGVQSDESALILLSHAVESQISLIFMTPHVMKDGKFFPSKALLETKLTALRRAAQVNNYPIQLKLSCEIMITPPALAMIQDKDYWGYQDTDYVLIEFMNPIDEKLINEALYELKRQGKKTIIAHPERYFSDPKSAIKTVRTWKQQGAYFQVNKTSLFTNSKASTRRVALALIEANLIQIIATDAHHAPGRRECRLQEAYQELIRLFDQKTADDLCITNPTLLSENKALLETVISNHWFSRIRRALRFKHSTKP